MKKIIIILFLVLSLTSCRQKDLITETEAPIIIPQTESETIAVYTHYIGNKKTKNYHKPTCSYLPHEKNQIKIPSEEIRSEEYQIYNPCGHCTPQK